MSHRRSIMSIVFTSELLAEDLPVHKNVAVQQASNSPLIKKFSTGSNVKSKVPLKESEVSPGVKLRPL